jgi:hypothetical protein
MRRTRAIAASASSRPAVGGERDEARRAPQPAVHVGAEVGMVPHPGQHRRVEHLEQQPGDAADHHGGDVAMDPPGDRARAEQPVEARHTGLSPRERSLNNATTWVEIVSLSVRASAPWRRDGNGPAGRAASERRVGDSWRVEGADGGGCCGHGLRLSSASGSRRLAGAARAFSDARAAASPAPPAYVWLLAPLLSGSFSDE